MCRSGPPVSPTALQQGQTHFGSSSSSPVCPASSSVLLLSSTSFVSVGLDSQSVLQHFGKGKPIPAVIEAASSGASLRATLLPEHYFVSVMLVGIVCPSMNRRPAAPTGAAAGAPASQAAPAAAEEGGEPATNGHAGTVLANSRGVQSVLQPFICDLTELTCTSKGSADWPMAGQCNTMLVVIPNPWLDAVSFWLSGIPWYPKLFDQLFISFFWSKSFDTTESLTIRN